MYIVTKYKKTLTPISLCTLGVWGLRGIEAELKDWFKWQLNETNVECKFYDDYFSPNKHAYIPDYTHLWLELESMFGVHNSYVNKIGLFNINDEQELVIEIKSEDNDRFFHTSYWIIERDEDNKFETSKIELDHDFNVRMLNNFDLK